MSIVKSVLVTMLALAFLVAGCTAEKKDAANGGTVPAPKQTAAAQKPDKTEDNITTYRISNGSYSVDDPIMTVKINYPQIINLGDIDRQIAINEILKKAALRYGKYDVEPEFFTDKYKGSPDRYWAQVEYKISWQSENVLSVIYKGSKHFPRRPHPNDYLDGINIDIKKGRIILLPDLVTIDKSFGFAEKFQAGKLKPRRPSLIGHVFFSNDPTMKDKGAVFTETYLVERFNKPYNHYYLRTDSLCIIVPVEFALGGAAEFEIKYADIAENIKTDNPVWKDFFPDVGK